MGEPVAQRIVDALAQTNSFAIVDDFLPPAQAFGARDEMLQFIGASSADDTDCPKTLGRYNMGTLAGQDGFWALRYDPTKRSDYTLWLTEEEMKTSGTCTNLLAYLHKARGVAAEILRSERLVVCDSTSSLEESRSVPSLECSSIMLCLYPTSRPSRFTRHVDNPNANGRIITFTFYLNEGWVEERDGGELHIFSLDHSVSRAVVSPAFNRLAVFFSDGRTPHEVAPTKPNAAAAPYRMSITLWFSYLTAQQQADAYAGAFRGWIERIKARKAQQQLPKQDET